MMINNLKNNSKKLTRTEKYALTLVDKKETEEKFSILSETYLLLLTEMKQIKEKGKDLKKRLVSAKTTKTSFQVLHETLSESLKKLKLKDKKLAEQFKAALENGCHIIERKHIEKKKNESEERIRILSGRSQCLWTSKESSDAEKTIRVLTEKYNNVLNDEKEIKVIYENLGNSLKELKVKDSKLAKELKELKDGAVEGTRLTDYVFHKEDWKNITMKAAMGKSDILKMIDEVKKGKELESKKKELEEEKKGLEEEKNLIDSLGGMINVHIEVDPRVDLDKLFGVVDELQLEAKKKTQFEKKRKLTYVTSHKRMKTHEPEEWELLFNAIKKNTHFTFK